MKVDNVESVDVDIPIEEAYRRVQNSLQVSSWVKTQSGHSFTVIGGQGYFTFDLVPDGTHKSTVIYRSDLEFSKRLIETTLKVLQRDLERPARE